MFEIPGSQDVEIENGSIRQAWEKVGSMAYLQKINLKKHTKVLGHSTSGST
jgi:hypothetical protein